MGLLLDTDAFLWFVTDDRRLSRRARRAVEAGDAELPSYHRDPFDRLIIAQALVERMPIVSGDPEFKMAGAGLPPTRRRVP